MKTTIEHISMAGIDIILSRKTMRSIRMRVKRPGGEVHISAPHRMSLGSIESFVESRVAWIEEQRGKIGHARFQIHLEYVDGEKVFFLGEEYVLHVFEGKGKMRVENMNPLSSSSAFPTLKELALFVPSGSTRVKREAVMEGWYREQLRNMIGALVTHWEPILSVRVKEYGVKKMKTRWGTCSIGPKRIWLALALAKHPSSHLEYVVVHEMTHLLERGHGPRFQALMTRWLPDWRATRKDMNEG